MKSSLQHYIFLAIYFFVFITDIWAGESLNNNKNNEVIERVKKAKTFIKEVGKEKEILTFRMTSSRIFAINFDGKVLASPLHPETIGTNQFDFKDASGLLAVQEEIAKAKVGGGWLQGRLRQNHATGKFACRKIYILPMQGNYLIGSWYYYPADKKKRCLI
ncbi:hypothetical protein Lsan_3869 [Legionella santicrucis]|uniref:Single Cache domain-containing protein n=1 Tax=Legionella santicrucis TaxID=45074 RepID=A0A0W0YA75_9GAMM|nr:cache domain-containing protein [Legionella santicrucis]KTD53459.1 hypothetical protein Lsan_3869 [Legionella santicrucis]